jgi:2-phospho-L-lactate transferase/gluconeogenesis factor (CofD/UPF0052 family)
MQAAKTQLRVSMFCGGRGSASITRELLRWPNIQLNLLVNAYDDGLSTGDLREFIPGMLGPSDFRKNLSHILDLYSNQQHTLQRVLEYRLPLDFSGKDLDVFEAYVANPTQTEGLSAALRQMITQLDNGLRHRLLSYLDHFFRYRRESGREFRFADCSLGNLFFAGAYLEHKGNFNAATKALADLFGSQARLINVSKGENRTLVALKEGGEILCREAEIVGPQSDKPIHSLFFLSGPLESEAKATLCSLSFEEERERLAAMDIPVEISAEAKDAILSSDVIIYGPGTQFSSLMPSYRIEGLREALRQSHAGLKIMVMNLATDHDIRSMNALGLVDKLLDFLGDRENRQGYVTHILYNRNSAWRQDGLALPEEVAERGTYKRAAIVQGEFENSVRPTAHNGFAVANMMMDLLDRQRSPCRQDALDIYVDLLSRSIALDSLIQEFLELPWRQRFGRVRLHVNRLKAPSLQLPEYLELHSSSFNGPYAEQEMLEDWLARGDSEYLATITGDGEYRLRDILRAANALEGSGFGIVQGSRTQSRRQFASSLRSAYGEGTLLYLASWMGAFLLTSLFALRFKLVLSDTLTGFRLYRYTKVREVLARELKKRSPRSALGVTKLLVQNNVEIAEIPVSYRTFRGFTKVSWRMKHALDNILSVMG